MNATSALLTLESGVGELVGLWEASRDDAFGKKTPPRSDFMKLRRANLAKAPPHVKSRFEILPRPKNISAVVDESAKIFRPTLSRVVGARKERRSVPDKTRLGKKKINFSTVFAGQAVGIKEVHDDIWLVSFMEYDLGYFDLETRVLEPLENPFGPKVLPMS